MPFRKIVPRNLMALHSPNENVLARLTNLHVYFGKSFESFTIIYGHQDP